MPGARGAAVREDAVRVGYLAERHRARPRTGCPVAVPPGPRRRRAVLRCRSLRGQFRARAAPLVVLHPGRGPRPRPIRRDRARPRRPGVPAGLQRALSSGGVRDRRRRTARPRLYRGPPSGFGILDPATGPTTTGAAERAAARATGQSPARPGNTTDGRHRATPRTLTPARPCGGNSGPAPRRPRAAVLEVPRRHRVVPAQRLFRRPGRQPREHDPAVVTDQHRTGGDVPVHPAMGVQRPQRGEHVGGDLGRPVRGQRLLREQGGEGPGGHQFAHYPQRAALGEHVEDLVEPGMVGDLRGGLRGLDGPPYGRFRGPARGPRRTPARSAVPRDISLGQPVRVEYLRLDDLGQRHLPYQDFLPAVGVEGPGLGEFVLVGGRQRQAIAVGEHSPRVFVHDALPDRPVGQFRSPCVAFRSGCVRSAALHDTCRRQLTLSRCDISFVSNALERPRSSPEQPSPNSPGGQNSRSRTHITGAHPAPHPRTPPDGTPNRGTEPHVAPAFNAPAHNSRTARAPPRRGAARQLTTWARRSS